MSVFENHQLIHSVYVKLGPEHDAVVANIKNVDTNESQLFIVRDPMVKVWVTKPGLRNHSSKKEYADLRELDVYNTKYNEIGRTLAVALDGQKFSGRGNAGKYGYINTRKYLSSPYVYGADIDIGVRLKLAFRRQCQKFPTKYNVGTLDIESSVLGNNEIILISFINGDGRTYCSIFKPFFRPGEGIEQVKSMFEKRVNKQFRDALKPKIQKLYDEHPLDITYHESDDEAEVIKWLFDQIHACKPDFIVIWNMGYDIPRILERCEFLGLDPKDVFCHPDVPKELRYVKYYNDPGKPGDHIVDHWDWFQCPGYTCFIDAMQLYGRLRKAKGRDVSYRLDYIGAKELGTGKLDFGQNRTHYDMQTKDFVGYTVYNIVDNAILYLMNWKNNDIKNLLGLIGASRLEDFSKQTVQLKNYFFEWLQPQGKVPASVGEPLDQPYDRYIINKGGAVLDPLNALGTGVPILKESDTLSSVQKIVCDEDVKLAERPLASLLWKQRGCNFLNCWKLLMPIVTTA